MHLFITVHDTSRGEKKNSFPAMGNTCRSSLSAASFTKEDIQEKYALTISETAACLKVPNRFYNREGFFW